MRGLVKMKNPKINIIINDDDALKKQPADVDTGRPKIKINTKPNMGYIRQILHRLKRANELTEVRILNTSQGVISGYFDNFDQLEKQVKQYDDQYNIYVTINPVNDALKTRSYNVLNTYTKQATTDSDIDWIVSLLIDFDPIRPAGLSATNAEKAEAEELMKKVKAYLLEEGFPQPFEADSGNGYHLILPVDLENTPENVQMLKKFLEALHFRFSTKTAEVDRTTYNPARITKLYGTMACKGYNTEERPHRRSELLHAPEKIQPATIDQIMSVVSLLPEVNRKQKNAKKKWDIPALIEKHGLDLDYEKPYYKDGTVYVLKTCPWNPEHTNSAAYIIQYANGAVAAGCHHNGCLGEDWQSLKKLLGETSVSKDKESAKQSDVILELLNDCELLRGDDGEEYAIVVINGNRYVVKIKSKKFKQFMQKCYYEAKKTAPGSEAVNQALEILAMKASFGEDEIEINRRVGMSEDGKYYYDLNHDSRYVQMTSNGCSIVTNPDVYFFQPKNMGRQVEPDFSAQPEDLIDLIGKHFRIKNIWDILLFACYLVSCLITDIPHPILILFGEKGSAKSTSMRLLKRIVDPARQDVLAMPSANSDLSVTLTNHYMPCFDNLSYLSVDKSNILCMAATGGSISKRTLYTDSDETILEIKRCVVLNGINIVANQPDLLDRSITLELSRISVDERLPEDVIWNTFNADLPKIMGSIFNILSTAITKRQNLQLEQVGRMADFSYWGYAIAEAMGKSGQEFLNAYLDNQNRVNEEALASNPVATAMIALMRENFKWSSSVSKLLFKLEMVAGDEQINTHQKIWPADANVLSKRLKEVKSNLEEIGIQYEIRHAGDYKKIIITNVKNEETGQIIEDDPKKNMTNTPLSELGTTEALSTEAIEINTLLD
ncbi:hypothetical protein DSECCO2_347500 [anaerobic digester metagenome]